MSLHKEVTPPKSGQPHSEVTLEEDGEGKSSQGTELQAIHLFILSQLKDYGTKWAITNGLVEWSGMWKEQDQETGNKEVGKRQVEGSLSEWALKIFCTPCESPKGIHRRGGFQ